MEPADTSPRRVHLASGLIVLATFLAGAGAGAGLYASFARPHGPPLAVGPTHGPMAGMPYVFRELGLDDAQTQKARALFDAHRAELEKVATDTFPRVRAIQDKMDEELRGILTPEQVKKLEEHRKQRPAGPPWMGGGRGMGLGPGMGMGRHRGPPWAGADADAPPGADAGAPAP